MPIKEGVRRLPTTLILTLLLALFSAGALCAAPTGAPGMAVAGEQRPAAVAARISGPVAVHVAPGASVSATLATRTEFGSPQTVAVVERRGRWLGVTTSALPNGQIGWIDARAAGLSLRRIDMAVEIDLSRRLLTLERGGKVVRRIAVGIGRAGSPTPIGHFAVTDEISGERYGSYYGCCIIALSAHQPNLPVGWRGGNRIAIHGTNVPASIGVASSAGCLHATDRDLRYLMARLPLGTPVTIHP